MSDAVRARLLTALDLVPEATLSDDGNAYVTLACRDRQGAAVVLKYVRPSAAPDASLRLGRETAMLQGLSTRAPLGLLRHRTSGDGFLVTERDDGRLLVPGSMREPRVCDTVADALAAFHSAPGTRTLPVSRESVAVFYLKVLAKHLLHLWPAYISVGMAAKAAWLVLKGLPSIARGRTLSHGDFLPTNLLFHDTDGTVTFTDFEGVALNHPLFDVLAIFTIDDRPIESWDWQPRFLRRYLSRLTDVPGLDPSRDEFWTAYRAILVFFAVYRFNEALLPSHGGVYFGGVSKGRFAWTKAKRLLLGVATPGDRPAGGAETRAENMRSMLAAGPRERHIAHMRAAATDLS